MLSQNLMALGLTQKQVQVYEFLLDNPQTKATAIINHLQVNRAVVYKILDDLIAKKLVAKVMKDGIGEYLPLEPVALEEALAKQHEVTTNAIKAIKAKISTHKAPKTDFFAYNGTDGIIEFFNFVVSLGEDWYIIGANFGMQQQEDYRREIPDLQAKISAKGMKTFIIADQKTENLNWVPNSEIHYLDDRVHPSSTVIQIFGDYVAHILWQKPEFVFVFKNKVVADDYRKYYNLLKNNLFSS